MICLCATRRICKNKPLSPYRRYPPSVRGRPLSEHGGDVTGHGAVAEAHTGPAEAAASDVPREVQVRHSYLVCRHTVSSITKNGKTVPHETLHQFLYAKSPAQKIQITL